MQTFKLFLEFIYGLLCSENAWGLETFDRDIYLFYNK